MQIRGAAQHNLQNLDIDLPDCAMIVLTGVSGSGKTSLATHTILAESRRRMREALPEQHRIAGTDSPPPQVEEITGLPPALGLTTATRPRALELLAERCDLLSDLRRLWVRAGVPHCPGCGQAIRRLGVDAICREVERAIQRSLQQSLQSGDGVRGGRMILLAPVLRNQTGRIQPVLEELQRSGFARVRLDGEIQEIAEVRPVDARMPHTLDVVVDRIRLEAGRDPAQRAVQAAVRAERLRESVALGLKVGKGSISVGIDGQVTVWGNRLRCDACDRALIAPSDALLSHRHRRGACPACRGSGCATCAGERLCPEGRAVRLEGSGAGGPSLPEALMWTVEEAFSRATAGGFPEGRLSAQIRAHLGRLIALGLGGATLGAPVAGLSRSIQQRARLGALLGRPLAGALYVLEEPTAGLAETEIPALVGLMRGLVEAGCTVIATDHALPLIRAADHVVELGPGAGPEGGRLLFAGTPEALAEQDTPTGRALSGRLTLTRVRRALDQPVWISAGGRAIPLQAGRITGVAGDGGLLDEVERQIRAGQAPLSRWAVHRADPPAGQHGSARSMVATISGVWPLIRRLLAHTREAQRLGFGAERFGLHAGGGRCLGCRGRGRVEDQVCATCEGGRFDEATRSVRWRGHSAADLLALSVTGARELFQNQPRMAPLLARIAQAGLGYLPLGMGGDQLSGGERQRLRLARALAGPGEEALWLLEEPSAGLHLQDLRLLLDVLEPVAEAGGAILLTDRSGALLEACDVCR